MTGTTHDHRGVLDFWFATSSKAHWFAPSDAFDAAVRKQLGGRHGQAAAGEIDGWAVEPEGLLALVILLDQAPRNIYRGTALAFATDAKALALARLAVDRGFDQGLDADQRLFLYLPFEHSEHLADQERSVALFRALGDQNYLDYAIRHREIVARFGRFPHRNTLLGRTSTAEELAFLEEPGSSF